MLSNIVGTLLAFVTIMLMLSLIITSLVQVTQATLRLRGRNLLVGIGALIEKHAPQANVTAIARSPLRWNAHAAVAAHVLNEADAPAIYLSNPNSSARVIWGPPTSWVDPNDLARAILKTAAKHANGEPGTSALTAQALSTSATNAALAAKKVPTPVSSDPAGGAPLNTPAVSADESEAAIAQSFKNMEPAISKRFQFIMRLWTVAYSFLIAFIFQLSTPDLLKQLPAADAKRQAILAAVPTLTSETSKILALSKDDFLEEALKQLGGKYPDYRSLFEEVAGREGESKQEMLDALRDVLGRRSNREQVLSDYAAIIDSLNQGAASSALENSTKLIDQLDTFGISPKLGNFDFFWTRTPGPKSIKGEDTWCYTVHWNSILGVLITGILLSLGAPFWFQSLKTLSSLRDAMNPSSTTKAS